MEIKDERHQNVENTSNNVAPAYYSMNKNQNTSVSDRLLHLDQENEITNITNTKNFLIKSYSIKKTTYSYNYFRQYSEDLELYYSYETEKEVPFVSFYSFKPQYSQMTQNQRDYYFYFRTLIRHGKFPEKETESYLALLISEIVNLTDTKITPEDGMLSLCKIWNHYYGSYYKFDEMMSNLIIDYYLIYQVPIPITELPNFRYYNPTQNNLLRYYIGSINSICKTNVLYFIQEFSEYHFERSPYYLSNKELFDEHINQCVANCINYFLNNFKETITLRMVERDVRIPFYNIVFSKNYKYVIDVMVSSFGMIPIYFSFLTGVVKYSENVIRKKLSIKSRLTVPKDFPKQYMDLIDSYFDHLPPKQQIKPIVVVPEYEKLYDSTSNKVSFEEVNTIESHSWENTKKLLTTQELQEFQEINTDVKENNQDVSTCFLGKDEQTFLTELLHKQIPSYPRTKQDSLVEAINNFFIDSDVGDIVIEDNGTGYELIPDYINEVEKWLKTK